MREEWRVPPLPGLDLNYWPEVSNLGRIRINGVVCKTPMPVRGYKAKSLRFSAHCRLFSIHRLVAMAFCREKKNVVNHKNLVKSDNRAANLEWVSKSEDLLHAHLNGAFDKRNQKITLPIETAKQIASALGVRVDSLYRFRKAQSK